MLSGRLHAGPSSRSSHHGHRDFLLVLRFKFRVRISVALNKNRVCINIALNENRVCISVALNENRVYISVANYDISRFFCYKLL